MRAIHAVLTGLVVVVGFVSAQPLTGQTRPDNRGDGSNRAGLHPQPAAGALPELHAAAPMQEPVGRKHPLLAGVLSAYLPGIGSYYAGNSAHGTRHLLIAGGSLALMGVGAILWTEDLIEDCIAQSDCDDSGGGGPLIAVGGAVYLMNVFWAVATAVTDANAHNRTIASGIAQARLPGGLYVIPTVHLASSHGVVAGAAPRPGPRLGVRFTRSF